MYISIHSIWNDIKGLLELLFKQPACHFLLQIKIIGSSIFFPQVTLSIEKDIMIYTFVEFDLRSVICLVHRHGKYKLLVDYLNSRFKVEL